MALVSVGAGAVGKGSLSGSTIAFTIRSVDRSLSIRLIAPTVWGMIEISSPSYGTKLRVLRRRTPLILDKIP